MQNPKNTDFLDYDLHGQGIRPTGCDLLETDQLPSNLQEGYWTPDDYLENFGPEGDDTHGDN